MSDGTGAEQPGADRPAEPFWRLREKLLGGTAASHGLEPELRVWGVVMEMGYPEGVATVACLADGRAQILFSHGGAVLGGGAHESVQLRARAIVSEAERFSHLAEPADDRSLPRQGRLRTYFLTRTGVLVAESPQQALERGQDELTPLLHALQTVVTELIRIAGAQERGEQVE
jgi:hypothetical protein